jgi:all-trans-retinol 13,14-reductase
MKHLVFHELATPLSTHYFTRSWEGGIYGYETTPERFGNPYLTAHSPVSGLYLTGGDVVAPGVAGALVSGVITAAAIKPRVFLKLM